MPPASGCLQTAANPTGCGGFTIASENPVYIQGNYNTTNSGSFLGHRQCRHAHTDSPFRGGHHCRLGTVLSNQWTDMNSLDFPHQPPVVVRPPHRRITAPRSLAAKTFPSPYRVGPTPLRILEPTEVCTTSFAIWKTGAASNLNYDGSLVSMYYAEYNTGIYKDGGGPNPSTVYSPPPRNYYFDVLFLNPANLPPATPEFQDIDSLSSHQNFTPQ